MSTNTPVLSAESLEAKVKKAAEVVLVVPEIAKSIDGSVELGDAESNEAGAEKYVWDRLAMLGIYKDADSHELLMSKDCSEGEVRRAFCENGEPNVPSLRFKRIWSILREGVEEEAPEKPAEEAPGGLVDGLKGLGKEIAESLHRREPGQWKDKELLEAYGPDCDPEIIQVLDRRAHGKPFVIFKDEANSVVDVEASRRALCEVRNRGKDGKHLVIWDFKDCLKRPYRAGFFPSIYCYESPFCPEVILMESGLCDATCVNWGELNYEILQFARIAYEIGDAPTDKPGMRQFVRTARQSGIDGLSEVYPETALVFKERKDDGTLPNLKKRISTTVDGDRAFDPMDTSKKKRY